MPPPELYNPGREAVAQTAAPNIQAVQERVDPNESVSRLLAALGTQGAQQGFAEIKAQNDQLKLQEQTLKISSMAEQFMQDHQGGAVSQAQVKARFPEAVPVISARIAEMVGRKQGAQQFQPVVDEINGNDALRLDTAARTAFIQQKRKELFGAIQPGNEFYAAGAVQAMDRAIQENDLKWQGQTAAYHEKVQKDGLMGEAVDALNSADPRAAFEAIDSSWGKSSSLNNVERNAVFVDATIKHAAVSDDISVLDKLPQRYLNADTKAAIQKAKVAITNQQWANISRNREMQTYARQEELRQGKLGIVQRLANGQAIDAAQYIQSPELHDYAVAAMSQPTIPEATSKAAASAFEQNILSSGMVGRVGTQQDITQSIFSLRGRLNPKDMADLIEKVPKMIEGSVLMNSEQVRTSFRDHIAARLDTLEKSPAEGLLRLLNGINLRGKASDLYEGEIQRGFKAFYDQHQGTWPGGFDARQIVNDAVSVTSAFIDRHSTVDAIKQYSGQSIAVPAAASAGAAKQAPSGLPKGVTRLPN